MANSADVDAAIAAKLAGDPTLTATLPGGVFFDVPPPGATKFVVLTLETHVDMYEFQDRAWEEFTYLVKAVTLGTSGSDVKAAAARIDALLHDAVIVAPGFQCMRCQRIEYVRDTEVDDETDARWQHRGGYYEVWMQPTTPPAGTL